LRAQVDPGWGSDPWPEETLAQLTQEVLESGLRGWITGREEVLGAVIGPRSSFPGPLRPLELEVATIGPEFLVREGRPRPSGEARVGIAGARQRLGALLAAHRNGDSADVEVRVDSVDLEDGALASSGVFVRIYSQTDERVLQTNLRLTVRWRLGNARVVLASLVAEYFQEVQGPAPLFADRTTQFLGTDVSADSWLWQGAQQSSERTDNLIVFTDVHLGMHGSAIGDLDGDGLEDVYVARHGGTPNLLLRHQADGSVRDTAPASGVDFLDDTSGVLIVDLDGDGARDLALGIGTQVVLCWNDGQGRFPKRTLLTRSSQDKVYSLAAADADGDGDLDLYDTRYFASNYGGGVPTPYHDAHNGAPNSLWRNQGRRSFEEATAEVGLDAGNDRFSLVSLWEDVDGDGDLDLYVVNDFGSNNLYRNDQGQFVDSAASLGLGDMAAGMGISPSDINGDGRLDFYVSNMHTAAGQRVTANERFMPQASSNLRAHYRGHTRGNSVLIQGEVGRFHDGSAASLAAPGGWAWGAVHVDMNNDGWDEFVVPNGFITGRDSRDLASFFWRCVVNASPSNGVPTPDYQNAWAGITRLSQVRGYCWNGNERHYTYLGGPSAQFSDISRMSGLAWKEDGRVALRADWDGDGLEDLILKNRSAPVLRFMHNQAQSSGAFVAIELVDGGPNTEAVGALVRVKTAERILLRRVYAGEGFLAGQSKRLHFGLGSMEAGETLEWVRVTWPDGEEQEVRDLAVGELYRWDRRESGPRTLTLGGGLPPGSAAQPLPSAPLAPRPDLVALERVPCSALNLPRLEGEALTVADYSGNCLLVYLWATWDGQSVAGLATLAAARERLERAGLKMHPLAFDGPRALSLVAKKVGSVLPESPGGRVDRRTRPLLELLLQSTLGAYDDLALPAGLLMDPDGRLVAVHMGPPDVDRLVDQAQRLHTGDARDAGRFTFALTGGRWLGDGPARNFTRAIEFLGKERGEEAFADELQAFVERR